MPNGTARFAGAQLVLKHHPEHYRGLTNFVRNFLRDKGIGLRNLKVIRVGSSGAALCAPPLDLILCWWVAAELRFHGLSVGKIDFDWLLFGKK